MIELQRLAESYLNGCMTANEFALASAMEITRIADIDVDTLAFLISYGEMPQKEA